MHILIVAHYAPPHQGGIEFVIGQLYRRYAEAGHRVTILACDAQIPKSPELNIVAVPALNTLERFGIPFPLFNPVILVEQLRRLLPRVDAVHAHGMLYLSCVFAAWMARGYGRPVVLTDHVGLVTYDSALVNFVQRVAVGTLGWLTCQNSDTVVVLNERVASEVKPLLRRHTPLLNIPNGVDTGLFRPPDDRAAPRAHWGFMRPTALFVGRMVGKKGGDIVLEAARHTPEIDYVFCGRDTERVNGLLPNVRSVGEVDQAALALLYGAADALVLPSESEGFPLVVQEALACGLPVVVTDNSTNREYLDETAAIFIPRAGDALASALSALLADPHRCQAMGTAARAWAVTRFDWGKTAEAYLALLNPFA